MTHSVFLRHDQTSFRDPKVFGPRIVSLSTSITAMPGSGNLPPSSGPLPAYANCRHDRTGACGSCNIVPGHRILHTPFANSRGNARDRILVSAPQVVSRVAVKPRSLRTVLAIPCTHHTPQIKAAGCCRLRPRLRQGVRPSLHPPVRDRP